MVDEWGYAVTYVMGSMESVINQMIKNSTAKYWKQTHHARKDSVDSLNDSLGSNHSSLSSGYNRFKFQPKQSSLDNRPTLFQFTARNKHQPFDISLLTKRSDKGESRKSLDLQLPVRDNLPHFESSYKDDPNTPRVATPAVRDLTSSPIHPKQPNPNNRYVKDIAKELKYITNSLKRAIDYFANQLRELKLEWDFSIQKLLKQQVSLQNSSIMQLRDCLQQKEKEIQKFRLDFANIDKRVQVQVPQKDSLFKVRQVNSINDETSMSKLAISHIQPKNSELEHQLSRNNTLNSLLGDYKRSAKGDSMRDNRQLFLVKQAVKRMRDALDVTA